MKIEVNSCQPIWAKLKPYNDRLSQITRYAYTLPRSVSEKQQIQSEVDSLRTIIEGLIPQAQSCKDFTPPPMPKAWDSAPTTPPGQVPPGTPPIDIPMQGAMMQPSQGLFPGGKAPNLLAQQPTQQPSPLSEALNSRMNPPQLAMNPRKQSLNKFMG